MNKKFCLFLSGCLSILFILLHTWILCIHERMIIQIQYTEIQKACDIEQQLCSLSGITTSSCVEFLSSTDISSCEYTMMGKHQCFECKHQLAKDPTPAYMNQTIRIEQLQHMITQHTQSIHHVTNYILSLLPYSLSSFVGTYILIDSIVHFILQYYGSSIIWCISTCITCIYLCKDTKRKCDQDELFKPLSYNAMVSHTTDLYPIQPFNMNDEGLRFRTSRSNI
jgi:hypothetical protein